jgi:tetratricopeptide (TPR) repeat protein
MQTRAPILAYDAEEVVKQLALFTLALLFAGTLCADSITHFKGSGNARSVETLHNVTITAWNAARVEYRTVEGQTANLPTADVISVNRTPPGMSRELTEAIRLVGSNPEAAKERLATLTTAGTPVNREEAAYWRARIAMNEAAANPRVADRVINELRAYLRAYKAGYFAREIYAAVANLQKQTNKLDDARATLREMIAADPALAREGNQLLGELEAEQARWAQAIAAFQQAKQLAARDRNKNMEYLAQAWEGACMLRSGDAAAARRLLEEITKNEAFNDPLSDDDDLVRSVAYPALGDLHYQAEEFEQAFYAYRRGAFYSWWVQGTNEGYCLGRAYLSARKLEGKDEKWKERSSRLRTALAMGFPRELQRIEQD